MLNLLVYAGFNVQSEVCFWTVVGILRRILDASVAFKVKSNLKQIWQTRMPSVLDVQLQRLLRTMISGVMVVQCVTVYIYLAAYIVLLYPIFLEEKPALVLPWLLLSLIRLLCELVNLSIGLASCVLLGSGKPPCVKFVVSKITKIAMSVYMWKLVYGLYQILQTATYKPIAMVLPASKTDDERNNRGLELAVRRRRTKSLLSEEELRKSILSDVCQETSHILRGTSFYNDTWSSNVKSREFDDHMQVFHNLPMASKNTAADTNLNVDYLNIDVTTPRDSDRVLDQFVTMILKIGVYLKMGLNDKKIHLLQISDSSEKDVSDINMNHSEHLHTDDVDSPPSVTSLSTGTFSYIREYPRIFLKDKFQSKLLQDRTNVINNNRNSKCSKLSIVRIKSDSSNTISPKRGDDESLTLENKRKSSDADDEDHSILSSGSSLNNKSNVEHNDEENNSKPNDEENNLN